MPVRRPSETNAQRWLDAYSRAWETYDPAAIGGLFAVDAEYRWHPWDEGGDVARGRDAIVEAWLKNRDKAGTYSGEYRPLLVHGRTVIAVGISRYFADRSQRKLVREYHNLWVLEFDKGWRCRSFTEWFMRSPRPGPRR